MVRDLSSLGFQVQKREQIVTVMFTDSVIVQEDRIWAFVSQLLDLLKEMKAARLLLHFAAVKQCGSAFIAAVVRINQRLKANGGQMALCGLDSYLREIFKRTRLDQLVPIYEEEQQALAALQV